jgi:hypothetical protein
MFERYTETARRVSSRPSTRLATSGVPSLIRSISCLGCCRQTKAWRAAFLVRPVWTNLQVLSENKARDLGTGFVCKGRLRARAGTGSTGPALLYLLLHLTLITVRIHG